MYCKQKQTIKHMKTYIVVYGYQPVNEHFFSERRREKVSKTTYYRRKKVWKNPPIGVKVTEQKNMLLGSRYLFVGFDD